jgi:hypothetical protein
MWIQQSVPFDNGKWTMDLVLWQEYLPVLLAHLGYRPTLKFNDDLL